MVEARYSMSILGGLNGSRTFQQPLHNSGVRIGGVHPLFADHSLLFRGLWGRLPTRRPQRRLPRRRVRVCRPSRMRTRTGFCPGFSAGPRYRTVGSTRGQAAAQLTKERYMRGIAQLLVGAALVLVPLETVGAFTLPPLDVGTSVSLVAQGCGPGWYRGPGGACHRWGHGPGPAWGYSDAGWRWAGPRPGWGWSYNGCPPRLLARPLGPLPRHALSWAPSKRRLAIGRRLDANWADGSPVAARPRLRPLPRARDVGRRGKVAGRGWITATFRSRWAA